MRGDLDPTAGAELSAAGRMALALEHLHDARLAADGGEEERALAELNAARSAQRAEDGALVRELDIDRRAEDFLARANGSLVDRALRGDRLWSEVLEEASSAVANGRVLELGIRDTAVVRDIAARPSRMRAALYAEVVGASYFDVRTVGHETLALAARAHNEAEGERLTEFLLAGGFVQVED